MYEGSAGGQVGHNVRPDEIAVRLAAAGLPPDDLLARRSQLPLPVQAMHRHILTTFSTTGAAPDTPQVEDWASQLNVGAAFALRALADAELIFLRANTATRSSDEVPAVTGAVPFAVPGATAHRVNISGGPEVTANCAVDALGIPAMIGRDVDVHSTDPLSGETVTAVSCDGRWEWEPATAVVFVGTNRSTGGRVTESCCPVINFFGNADNARAYQRRLALDGVVMSVTEAAHAGALVFGQLLDGQSAPTAEQAS